MAATKTVQMFNIFRTKQAAIWQEFRQIHDNFAQDNDKYRADFNRVGRDFINLARGYERRLCGGMERTNNSIFSATVGEKYWGLIRKEFPLIDQVGVITH